MKKTDKQKLEEEAIRMLASGLNQSETAKKLGISRQNISNWMKSPDFKIRIEKLKEDKRKYQQKQTLTTVKRTPHCSLPEPESESQVQPQQKVLSREYYFQKELSLLNEVEELMMPHVREGSVRAAALLLKLSERRSKLLALDTPQITEIEAATRLAEAGFIPLQTQKLIVSNFDRCIQGIKEAFSSPNQDVTLESPKTP
ncbi:MAG: helix-turn-helix domain-containing protein [Cyanobacteria bacterium P01_D01_bin.50]